MPIVLTVVTLPLICSSAALLILFFRKPVCSVSPSRLLLAVSFLSGPRSAPLSPVRAPPAVLALAVSLPGCLSLSTRRGGCATDPRAEGRRRASVFRAGGRTDGRDQEGRLGKAAGRGCAERPRQPGPGSLAAPCWFPRAGKAVGAGTAYWVCSSAQYWAVGLSSAS